MTGRRLRTSVAMLATMVAFALMLAGPGQADPTGPTAFYFGANCTGIGDVVLTNAGPSRAAALQVLGTNTIVVVPVNRGIEERGIAAGTTCTFHAFGPDPNDLEEIPNPETFPVVIVSG
jgi:hypothetical protein